MIEFDNSITGNGKIQQTIDKPSDYYIAVGNLNNIEIQVHIAFANFYFTFHNSTQWIMNYHSLVWRVSCFTLVKYFIIDLWILLVSLFLTAIFVSLYLRA